MNLRSLSLKTITAGLVLAIGIPAMAMAANPFEDVPDGQWYSEPVDWAYNEGITTGKTPTTFNGWDETNRYEVVTFVHRFFENVIAPDVAATDAEIAALQAEIDAVDTSSDGSTQYAMFGSDFSSDAVNATGTTLGFTGMDTSVTIPTGHDGVIVVDFAAESSCYGGDLSGDYCLIDILIDGESIVPVGFAFDSDDLGTESEESWEAHAARFVSDELPPGTYEIQVWGRTNDNEMTFRLDELTLTAEVKLTSPAAPGLVFAENG